MLVAYAQKRTDPREQRSAETFVKLSLNFSSLNTFKTTIIPTKNCVIVIAYLSIRATIESMINLQHVKMANNKLRLYQFHLHGIVANFYDIHQGSQKIY